MLKLLIISLLFTFINLPVTQAQDKDSDVYYYRYKNEVGNTVIKNTLPAEQAPKGYEIIDPVGRVIEVVKPALTKEDLARMSQQQLAEIERKKKAKKQEQYDLALLRKYSFVSDIEAEKARKIQELNIRVAILKGNLNSIRFELQAEYDKAAQRERRGKNVFDQTKNRISDLEKQLRTTEELLQLRLEGIAQYEKQYRIAIERFKEVELMRKEKKSAD